MSCSHLRGLDSLVIGTPGFIDYRVFPLSTYVSYNCQNTSRGPTISLKCNSCQIPRRNHYMSWQFVDLLNDPATAVGFQFNLTAKDHGDDRHVSFVSGTMKSESYTNDKPKTFRGPDLNILKIHLFPQAYHSKHNLKLIQPLFHDFIPGSSFSEASDLQVSLQTPEDGLINTTLYISYLSDYIVEIDNENVMSPGKHGYYMSHGFSMNFPYIWLNYLSFLSFFARYFLYKSHNVHGGVMYCFWIVEHMSYFNTSNHQSWILDIKWLL